MLRRRRRGAPAAAPLLLGLLGLLAALVTSAARGSGPAQQPPAVAIRQPPRHAGVAVAGRTPAATIWPTPARTDRHAVIDLTDQRARTAAALIVCLTPPSGRSRCRTAHRRDAGPRATAVQVYLGRLGRWQVELRAAGPLPVAAGGLDIKRTIDVVRGRPRLLATGDSEIQGIDDLITAGLPGLKVTSEAHISTGISKPFMFDWVARAKTQSQTLHPDVTVVYIGANDGFGLRTPSGRYVNCCGPDWVRAFAARSASMMASYSRGGAGRVYWFTLPAPRDQTAAPVFRAINRAYAIAAAAQLPGTVRLIDLSAVFTPGGRYRDSMFYGGREQTVREPDGYHLSEAGNRIATSILTADMRADGLLG